jgi:hypothetical protein
MSADDRDKQIAELIRREIDAVKVNALRCGWKPTDKAWHRAFGEIAGMYKIMALVDPDPKPAEANALVALEHD